MKSLQKARPSVRKPCSSSSPSSTFRDSNLSSTRLSKNAPGCFVVLTRVHVLYMLQTIFLQTFGKGDNETSRHHLVSDLSFTYTQAPTAVFLHQLAMLSRLPARPGGVGLVRGRHRLRSSKWISVPTHLCMGVLGLDQGCSLLEADYERSDTCCHHENEQRKE